VTACAASPRVVRLKLIGGGEVALDETVPRRRGECPKTRPCGHVRCRHHLWTILGDERRGRTAGGYRMGTTLYPGWCDWPAPPSCSLDFADALPVDTWADLDDVARAIRMTPDWTRRLIRRAMEHVQGAKP